MKKRTKIRHNELEKCSGMPLGVCDVYKVYAQCLQDVTEKIADMPERRQWLKESDWGVVLLLNADVEPTIRLESYKILGNCDECGSIIPFGFSPRIQLLHITLAYLIENGNFEGSRVRMPGEEELIEALKRQDIFLEFYSECSRCGEKNYSYLDEDGTYLAGKEIPKLTT